MLLTVKVVFVLLFLTFTINADLPGKWPELDAPPPFKDEWAKLVDQSKVPNAPKLKAVGDCGAKDDFCNYTCRECTSESDITQCPKKYDWGLTFDDGPSLFTVPLLDYLSSNQIKVTFFVVGSRVYEQPQILKKAFDAGHQIGVHTWSHTALTTQTNEEIIAEIKWTELAIKQVVGVTPKYMRPPMGDVDDRVRGVLSQLGYKVVIWDKTTNDWESDPDSGVKFQIEWVEGNFTEWVKEDDPTGHISLEHDLYKQTAAQGPKVVPIVQGAGFTIKSVASCLGDDNPYLESQPPTNSTVTAPIPTPTPVATAVVTTSNAVVLPIPAADPDTTKSNAISNAISYMKHNNYLLSLVLFIVEVYFM